MARKTGQSSARRRGGAALKIIVGLALVGALGGGAFAMLRGASDASSVDTGETFEVARGLLTISVTEAGTLQAREQEVIINRVKGRTEIIFIVDEGALVDTGDLLIELDSSALKDKKSEEEIQVENADAAFVRARENLAVAESQAKSDVSQAELDHRFAIEDKSRYIEGEYPKELTELESRITLALEELERAVDQLEGSERLFAEKYIAESELESDRLAKNRAELDYQLAVANKDLLEKYTYPRRIDELDSAIEQTKLALDRVKRKASADIVQAQANLRAAEVELDRQKDQLADVVDQISKTRIVAPTAGMVIYATSVNQRSRWGGNEEPLQEGYQAREREELIYLPTASSMMAKVAIHESALEKVRENQFVRVTVPAIPDQSFEGRVAKIAPLPDQSSWWNPDLRVYSTEIHLVGNVNGARTGMSCQAEIIVEEYDDAIYVPVQAVTRSRGEAVAFVADETGTLTRRPVDIGLDNNRMVRVVGGLEAGEMVTLSPPLNSAPAAGGPPRTAARAEASSGQARPASTSGGRPNASAGPASRASESKPAGAGATMQTAEKPQQGQRPTQAQIEQWRKMRAQQQGGG
ncbi:MAG: efflux RND transporter periplasmic adaptor subunit [Planctomycetota bacterium]